MPHTTITPAVTCSRKASATPPIARSICAGATTTPPWSRASPEPRGDHLGGAEASGEPRLVATKRRKNRTNPRGRINAWKPILNALTIHYRDRIQAAT
jgi:hypothetical protein